MNILADNFNITITILLLLSWLLLYIYLYWNCIHFEMTKIKINFFFWIIEVSSGNDEDLMSHKNSLLVSVYLFFSALPVVYWQTFSSLLPLALRKFFQNCTTKLSAEVIKSFPVITVNLLSRSNKFEGRRRAVWEKYRH